MMIITETGVMIVTIEGIDVHANLATKGMEEASIITADEDETKPAEVRYFIIL